MSVPGPELGEKLRHRRTLNGDISDQDDSNLDSAGSAEDDGRHEQASVPVDVEQGQSFQPPSASLPPPPKEGAGSTQAHHADAPPSRKLSEKQSSEDTLSQTSLKSYHSPTVTGAGLKHRAPNNESMLFEISGKQNMLSAIDEDGDGKITRHELERYVVEHLQTVRDKFLLKNALIGVGILLVVFAAVILGSTFGIVDSAKDTRVSDNSNALRERDSGYMVATENPRVYTTITDIALLPAAALSSLKHLSFTTVDGALHHYSVQGTRLSGSAMPLVYLYFMGNKALKIFNDTAVLQQTDPDGFYSERAVVLSSGSSDTVARRRLQLLQESEDDTHPAWESRRDLEDRCSITPGVCYHTFEEIQALNRYSDAEREEARQSGRRLASEGENSVTYAELTVDTAILKADSKSDLSQASSFLSGILGSGAMDDVNGTLIITFTMKERCANYADLVNDCFLSPAPDLAAATEDPTGVSDSLRPFIGLSPQESKWWFTDEIEYRKDPYTLQLKVRYSHDKFFSFRRHVVLMDIKDPTKIVAYDEVTLMTDPNDVTIALPTPTVYLTNYEVINALDDDALAGVIEGDQVDDRAGSAGRRRLSAAEEVFHAHIRSKIAGFPTIYVPDNFVPGRSKVNIESPAHGRRLADDDVSGSDDDNLEEAVAIESTLTSTNAHGLAAVGNTTQAEKSGLITNQTLYDDEYKGTVTNLPASTSNSTTLSGGSTAATQARTQEPTALYDFLDISSDPDLIQWVEREDTIDVEEYADAPIVQRATLKFERDRAAALAAEELANANDDFYSDDVGARLLMEHGRIVMFNTAPRVGARNMEKHRSRFAALTSHLAWMSEFVKQSHRDVATRPHPRHSRSAVLPLTDAEYERVVAAPQRELSVAAPATEMVSLTGQYGTSTAPSLPLDMAAQALATLIRARPKAPRPKVETAGSRRRRAVLADLQPHFDSVEDLHRSLRTTSISSPGKWTNRMDDSLALVQDEAVAFLIESLLTEEMQVTLAFLDEVKVGVEEGNLAEVVGPDSEELYTFVGQLKNLQSECSAFKDVADELLALIEDFLLMQEHLNDMMDAFYDGVADIQDLNSGLGGMEDLKKFMQPIIPMASKIPYGIGTLIKGFNTVYGKLVTATVSPINKLVTKIADQFTEARLNKLEALQDKNVLLGEKIMEVEEHLVVATMKLLLLDTVAATTTTCGVGAADVTATMCKALTKSMTPPVTALSKFRDDLQSHYNFAVGTVNVVLQIAYDFLTSSVWTGLSPVFDALETTFGTIDTFLNTRITVSVPWICWTTTRKCTTIKYPCGTKKCCKKKFGRKWCITCGVKMCSKSICVDLPVPETCSLSASATVMDILNGILSAVQPLLDAMDSAIEAALNALGISLPEITIPALPSDKMLDNMFNEIGDFFDFNIPTDLLDGLDDIYSALSQYYDITCDDLEGLL